jgi:hypothetical protein
MAPVSNDQLEMPSGSWATVLKWIRKKLNIDKREEETSFIERASPDIPPEQNALTQQSSNQLQTGNSLADRKPTPKCKNKVNM